MDAAAIVENAGNSGGERRLGKGCEHVQTGDVPAAVEFGRVAAAPVNTLRQQPHRCQEISVCF